MDKSKRSKSQRPRPPTRIVRGRQPWIVESTRVPGVAGVGRSLREAQSDLAVAVAAVKEGFKGGGPASR